MPGVTATAVTMRATIRYVVVVSSLGSIGVSKWENSHCTYPVIQSVSTTKVTLKDGTVIALPVTDWIEDAVFLWRQTAEVCNTILKSLPQEQDRAT
tara:strand:+ start:2026 stop:2313 length:288 start_codon:yes stop_codon:yes gene_type:complete